MKRRRHPIMGFFGGLLVGIGIAILLFVFGILPMTARWLGILALGLAILGLVLALVTPARARGATPEPATDR